MAEGVTFSYKGHTIKYEDHHKRGMRLLIDDVEYDKAALCPILIGSTLSGTLNNKSVVVRCKNLGIFYTVELYINGAFIEKSKYFI